MITFSELKNTKQERFDKLTEKLNALSNPQFKDDEDDGTYWKPTVDKSGSGYAVVRLLPAPDGEEDALVRIFSHAFQGPSGWYIEKSLTTLKKPDPCAEMNNKLWNTETEENRRFVQGVQSPVKSERKPGSKRKVNFYVNIYVVDDKGNPENNGKVFRWKFGKKIYEKIFEASHPKFEDTEKFDPFDLWSGCNLKVKVRTADGYPNYDDSKWDTISDGNVEKPRGALFNDDDKMEKVWRATHSLKALIDPSKFKTYNELKARLIRIMGDDCPYISQGSYSTGQEAKPPAPGYERPAATETPPWEPEPSEGGNTDDSEIAFFRELAGRA